MGRRRTALPLAAVLATVLAVVACEDTQAPEPAPSKLTIVSGNNQYTKQGTELAAPLVVQVILEDGFAGVDQTVSFQVVEGGGTVSRRTVNADDNGQATVQWTVGPTGPQRVIATAAANTAVSVQFQATSAQYYCPEEDPTFVRKFSPQHDLFLFTRQSTLLRSGGMNRVGVVQITPEFPTEFGGVSFVGFDEGALLNIVRDCAYSASGDFYLAWTQGSAVHEILKVNPDRSYSHFATLESFFGSEITLLPGGVLAGCDEYGPFTVGCRDTLTRYDDAMFLGEAADAANNDAVAVDPTNENLYFFFLQDRSLRRVPLDGYTQTGPTESVVTLEVDEAWGANGMVVDNRNGNVYILVDTDATKSIVQVTSAGVKTTVVDFFTERGAGDLAGIQNDLAIDQGFHQLYTLDTLNNVIVLYQIDTVTMGTLTSSGDPGAASDGSQGERVGLSVMP
jgi:hypothetical protein